MELLTISTVLYSIHHDVLCCHEWYLCHKVLFNNLWIYYQSIHHIEAEVKDSVYCKKALRYWKTLVCWIIKCSLKPLCSWSNCRIHYICKNISWKRCNSLTSHRISLICHGWWTYLILLKRLLYFLKMLEQSDIVWHLCSWCSNACEYIYPSCIYLTGICLTRLRITILKAHLLCDHRINLVYCLIVSVEELKEAGLCSCSALWAKEL